MSRTCTRSLTLDDPDVIAGERDASGVAQTQTIRCEGAGVKVVYQAREIAGGLFSVKPAVSMQARFAHRKGREIFLGALGSVSF